MIQMLREMYTWFVKKQSNKTLCFSHISLWAPTCLSQSFVLKYLVSFLNGLNHELAFYVEENTIGQVIHIKTLERKVSASTWNHTQKPSLRDNICKQAFMEERLGKGTRNRWFVFKTCLTFTDLTKKAYYGGNSWLPIRSTLSELWWTSLYHIRFMWILNQLICVKNLKWYLVFNSLSVNFGWNVNNNYKFIYSCMLLISCLIY